MPYKRPGSQFYQIRRRKLKGYGDTGVLATHARDRRTAERMEALLEDLAERALLEPRWLGLIGAVVDHRITLPDLLRAQAQRKLEPLLKSLYDPPLHDAIDAYEARTAPKRQEQLGLDVLRGYTMAGHRLSYLYDAKTITDLCLRWEREGGKVDRATGRPEGVKRNTVRRSLHRSISKLVTFYAGKAERDRIFAEVDYPEEDDVREVLLEAHEIASLIQACESAGETELSVIVRMALLTSADRGVLLAGKTSDGYSTGLLVRNLRIYQEPDGSFTGEVYLNDNKSKERKRTVPVPDSLCRELLVMTRGKAPDDPVFAMQYLDLDYPWQAVREAIGRPDIRFKDLRAQTAIYAQRAGIPQAVTMRTMGHSSERRTIDYQRHQAVMTPDQMSALEGVLFGKKNVA